MGRGEQIATAPNRLHSLDAFRGLDMLCIIGVDTLTRVLAKTFPHSGFCSWLAMEFRHLSILITPMKSYLEDWHD